MNAAIATATWQVNKKISTPVPTSPFSNKGKPYEKKPKMITVSGPNENSMSISEVGLRLSMRFNLGHFEVSVPTLFSEAVSKVGNTYRKPK